MAKKGKTPEGEKCERSLPFRLNDEDKARKGELASELNKSLEAATERKRAELKIHNGKIADLTKKVSAQLKMINEGVERKTVTCTAVKNFEGNCIEFWFEGQPQESIPMKPEDRQLKLSEKEKKAKVDKQSEKWQKLAPRYKPKNEAADDDKDREIAQVHQLETSRKSATSSVDPKT